jgi:hypothetical protein
VETLCQSAVVEKMRDSTRVVMMFGASRVLALYDRASCGRGCDGTVFTADRRVNRRRPVSSCKRYKRVKVVPAGESVLA